MNYDLEVRTKIFSLKTISVLKSIKQDTINKNIISQLIRSSTSVGANYCEANNASAKKDFRKKIFFCKKEIQETKYWIELVANTEDKLKISLRTIWKEAHELSLIFNKIANSLKN